MAESSKKRSRSPTTDGNEKKNAKRVNVGPSASTDAAKGESNEKDKDSVMREGEETNGHDSAVIVGEPESKDGAASNDGQDDATKDGQPTVPQTHINMRCLIVTQDASIIIGRGGAHVNEVRQKSGAKVMVSESIPGNPERILNVGGPLDAVSKAFGLIVRRINDEPFDVPSVPGSRPVTIKFMIPNSRMGSVIGKGGSKIKEIQEASGARLNASEGMLPGSTERVLSVTGVADAIHIATYYIGNVLIEANDRNPSSSLSNASYRPSSSSRSRPPPQHQAPPPPYYQHQLQEQKIFIPNDLVGCIIGKGGSKINEIRQLSQCTIKITEPAPAGAGGQDNERLVVVTGQPHNIQMAVSMLYHRLEQEKQKQLASR